MTLGARATSRAVVFAASLIVASAAGAEEHDRWAVSVFAGRMTDNAWEEVLSTDFVWAPVGIAGTALSWRFAGLGGLDFELEGQAVKNFGDQANWEFNVPVIARWTRFPWNERVETSAAFGIGLSWAATTPRYEVENDGDSRQLMTYWTLELEAGPPASPWSGFGRLHHRSTAYGTFGDDGGSNTLALGVRRRF